jgi:hypothetical protein
MSNCPPQMSTDIPRVVPMVHERLGVHIWVFEAASGGGEYLRHGGGNVDGPEASVMTTGPSPRGRDGSLQSPWSVRCHRGGLHAGAAQVRDPGQVQLDGAV